MMGPVCLLGAGDYEITTRWTMKMRLAINPFPKYWPAQMLFTGVSILGINPATGTCHDLLPLLSNQLLVGSGMLSVTHTCQTPLVACLDAF